MNRRLCLSREIDPFMEHQPQQPVLGANVWGADDFDRDDEDRLLPPPPGEGDDEDDEDAFADESLRPEDTCWRIEALAVAHVRGVLAMPFKEEDGSDGDDGDGGDGDGDPPAAPGIHYTVAMATTRVRDLEKRRCIFSFVVVSRCFPARYPLCPHPLLPPTPAPRSPPVSTLVTSLSLFRTTLNPIS